MTAAAPAMERIRLGQCASKMNALHKIEYWTPRGCRFYRIVSIGRDRRSAFESRFRSPYFAFEVEYSPTASPGFKRLVPGAANDPVIVKRHRDRHQRFMARIATQVNAQG